MGTNSHRAVDGGGANRTDLVIDGAVVIRARFSANLGGRSGGGGRGGVRRE